MAPFILTGRRSPLCVASPTSPPEFRRAAQYQCSGVRDDLVIQRVIDLAGTYASKGSGLEIRLGRGNYNCGASVNLRGHVALVGDQLGATQLNLNYGCNCDLLVHNPATSELGPELRHLTLNGNRYRTYGDSGVQLGCLNRITGLVVGGNTSASGFLYVSILDDGGGYRHIGLYSNAARSALVAHTATYNTTGLKALVADNGSGLGGYIGVLAVGSPTTAIYLYGNWGGRGFWGGANSGEGFFDSVEVMDFGSHGIQIDAAYGWHFRKIFPNVNMGHGLYITAGTMVQVRDSRCTNNAWSGIYNAALGAHIASCIVSAGLYQDAGLHEQGYAGVYNSGMESNVVDLTCENIRTGNFGVDNAAARCLFSTVRGGKVTGATSTTGIRTSQAGSRFVNWYAYQLNVGLSLGASGNYSSGGTADGCATGLSIAGSYSKSTGDHFSSCTTGLLSSSGDDNAVTGDTFDGCTTGLSLGAGCDGWNVSVNLFRGGGTGVNLVAGAGANKASLFASNKFSGQTVQAVADASSASGLDHFRGNDGCPNYDAGRRIAVSADLDMGAAGGEVYRDQTLVFAAADKTATLPAATGSRRRYPFARGIKEGSGTATVALPAGAHFVRLGGSVGGDNKALINTAGTSTCGDTLVIEDVAANAYNVASQIGTWDLQA